MKKLLFALAVLWSAGGAGYWYWNESRNQRMSFRTVALQRGDLLATITATGTLEPEEVVDVGTQIAGKIERFGADPRDPSKAISYGTPVDSGTVLAQLDDGVSRSKVDQARAGLARAEADVEAARVTLRKTERDYHRVQKLHARNSISSQEYDAALAEYESARARLAVIQAAVAMDQANLEEANVNLGYTTIRSPVKGVILDRRVNIGQTVVASLNAPSLFLIAKDLSRMEIWASVNETDVGSIHTGQGVRFTVGAFPGDTFRGKVAQIRLNASMTQSVVTYTVVVDVDNTAGKLLPYLTARLSFEVQERKGVLLVPNAALRWQPKAQHVAPEARAAFEQALQQRALAPRGEAKPRGKPEASSAAPGTLWVKRGEFVRPVTVRVEVTDGVQTEITTDELKEGSEVVLGLAPQGGDDEGGSPFLPKLKNDKAKK